MKPQGFNPKEVLFSITGNCNLHCAHCDVDQRGGTLNRRAALKFLAACAHSGIKRVGFTGGEPFLAFDLMCAISKEAVRRGMLFSRIMTNGAWFRTEKELASKLNRLFRSGYDGDLCMSLDAFHHQDIKKCAAFIKTAVKIWKRPDIVSIAAVKGVKEAQTRQRLAKLSRAIKGTSCFIKIFYIDLSPIGKASRIKNAWNGKWFKDDFCRGPGNVFFVLPNGTVKPCCGYANDADILTIGSIKKNSPKKLLQNARKNKFITSIFSSGFHPIRKRLEKAGVIFPGKTTSHCFFCHYLTRFIPLANLYKCL